MSPPAVEIEPRRADGDGEGDDTRLPRLVLAHQLTKFLVVGVLSYAADIAVLYVAHGRAHLALWLATSIAYVCGLLANFALNRVVTFRSTSSLHRQMGRYAALLVANYLGTLALVTGLTAAGLPYLGSKTICVALLAVVNFVAYRHWVFADDAG